jgi:hypothetical protein
MSGAIQVLEELLRRDETGEPRLEQVS